jgi:hypothetical protein
MGETVYVDDDAYTVAGFAERLKGRKTQLCPPYFGLLADDAPPALPLMTTLHDDGRPIYWLSHLRVAALLPPEPRVPVSGLARRRYKVHTTTASDSARTGRTPDDGEIDGATR